MSSIPEPNRLPTLTQALAAGDTASPVRSLAAEPEADVLAQRVLADLEQRVDLMLEYRLRESLSPALARLSDTLIREMRVELAATLRELIADAVARELERQRHSG